MTEIHETVLYLQDVTFLCLNKLCILQGLIGVICYIIINYTMV